MNNKQSRNHFSKKYAFFSSFTMIMSVVVAVMLFIGIIFLHEKGQSIKPSISSLKLDGNTLIISSKDSGLVYCVTNVNNSSDCEWENYSDFLIEEETTYYVFVKSIETGIVSKPESFTYKKLDYDNLRM